MRKLLCRAIFVVALFSIAGSAHSETWQELLKRAEARAESGNTDSARAIFEKAVQAAETQYEKSDSTIGILFYDEGVSRVLFFDSYNQASETYEALLAAGRRVFAKREPELYRLQLSLCQAYLENKRYAEVDSILGGLRKQLEGDSGIDRLRLAEVTLLQAKAVYFRTDCAGSEELFVEALGIAEQAGGENHPLVAQCLFHLANQWRCVGAYEAADSLLEKALAVANRVYSSGDPAMGDFLETLGRTRYSFGDYKGAQEAFIRSLKIRRDVLGDISGTVATALIYLGDASSMSEDYPKAESCYTEALAIRRKIFGSPSIQEACSIERLAWLNHSKYANLVVAESLYSQVIGTVADTASTGNSDYEFYLNSLVWKMYGQGRFMDALALLEKNLSISIRLHGESSRESAFVLRFLGKVSMQLGRFANAESYFKRALILADSVMSPDDPLRANIINELALNYDGQGRFEEAVELYKQGIAIEERTLKPDDPDRGNAFVNLGIVYWSMGRFDDAEANLLLAVSLFEPFAEDQANGLAIALLNLGLIYESQGRYKDAESALRRSIEIGETALGPHHPALAHALNNLCNVYIQVGRYADAEPLQIRAVDILEGSLGPEHPEVAKFRRDLGRLYAYAGKSAESLDSYKRFIEWSQRFLENVFPYSSETQKLTWMREYPIIDHVVFSLALSTDSPRAREVALEMLLKSKAMVIEAVMSERKAAYCIYDDATEAKLRRLNDLHGLIASVSMAGGSYADSLNRLYDLKDSLEVAISSHCSEFGDALAARRFDLSDISNALPETGVLWEFVRYKPYNLDPAITGDDKLLPDRYMAFIIDHNGDITARDLAGAARVDSLVLHARELLYKAQGQVYSVAAVTAEERLSEVTRQLYDMLFAPLASVSKGKTEIHIAPDGLLNLIPFEILRAPDDSYVIENYSISYLSSGRDLLKMKGESEIDGEMVLIADPDFDSREKSLNDAAVAAITMTSLSTEMYGPEFRGVVDCLESDFPPLGRTRAEAQSVAGQAAGAAGLSVRELYGVEAAEGFLKSFTTSPTILHLATHGFFCETSETSSEFRDNPLLRSGLALAGANRTIGGEREDSEQGEDGILTALEVSGLNLVGTELAVLSACESGVGDLVNGEGVFGLRRAFQHAGAQTVIISLWPIPDRETSQLMDGFYRRWLEGMTKRDALRQSAISVLSESRARRGCGHPLLWGGFILTGNPN